MRQDGITDGFGNGKGGTGRIEEETPAADPAPCARTAALWAGGEVGGIPLPWLHHAPAGTRGNATQRNSVCSVLCLVEVVSSRFLLFRVQLPDAEKGDDTTG